MKTMMLDIVPALRRLIGILCPVLFISVAGISELRAQSDPELEVAMLRSDAPGAIISLSAGPALTYARGEFPSLLVGNTQGGSGAIPAAYMMTGTGHSVDLEGLIYFSQRPRNNAFGMTLGLSSTRYVAQYDGDDTLQPTKLEVQQAEVRVGGHYDLWVNHYDEGIGFRSLYLEGGLEIGLGILGNRVEAGMIADTTSEVREPATGSFESGEPFRHRVAINVAAGTMIDLTGYKNGLSAVFEVGYSLGLNPVFSSDVLRDNNLSVDYLIVKGGLGYRF